MKNVDILECQVFVIEVLDLIVVWNSGVQFLFIGDVVLFLNGNSEFYFFLLNGFVKVFLGGKLMLLILGEVKVLSNGNVILSFNNVVRLVFLVGS